MSISRFEYGSVLATGVKVSDDSLTVELSDGRTVIAPLVWFPRLLHGTPDERAKWEFNGGGTGIHWPALDEDISVEGLLLGGPSRENARSLQKWLDSRKLTAKSQAVA
jgi:hypothetical protein